MTPELIEALTSIAAAAVFLAAMAMLLYFVWIRHVIQHSRAQIEIPRLAAELGLNHHPPEHQGKRIGTLTGRYRDYHVTIDAEANESSAKLQVRMKKEHELTVSRKRWGTHSNRQTIRFPHRRVNRYFKTRHAPPELADWLRQSHQGEDGAPQPVGGYRQAGGTDAPPDVSAALDDFVAKWGKQLCVCELDHDVLGCSPKLGSGENTAQSVSAAQVRGILPAMIDVARAIDALPFDAPPVRHS